MFLEERQAKILELLAENGKVLVKELAEMFSVTEDSIRKDLNALEADGQLKRTYGGAVPVLAKLQITSASRRRISNVEAKRQIAAAAVKLITPGRLIFLDASTISIAIAEILERRDAECKILTNMVDVLVMLARNPKIQIIFAGGQINPSRDGFIDGLNLEFTARFRPDISFVGVVGLDVKKNSLTTNGVDSGLHKAKILEISKSSYVMAESRKFGVEGNYKFATLENVHGLITETEPAAEISKAVRKMNLEIILPD
ncbi:MAG: DeoR/GlpR transcriptional regulator [Selenomonadaceae bacterium]|nr:DeoR/GlpR transcriptional regulator [Selenomonadaceae bacterium]